MSDGPTSGRPTANIQVSQAAQPRATSGDGGEDSVEVGGEEYEEEQREEEGGEHSNIILEGAMAELVGASIILS
jgi:hypothetical protein